ncbi:MAG: ABC transporter substrate-binding protein [Kofleriaceae bacterium]
MRLAAALMIVGWASSLAFAESRPRYGGEIQGALLGAPGTLDPIASQSHAEVTAIAAVFDTLYQLDAGGRPNPHVAAGIPVLDAGSVRIAIRRGIRFHDGSELTPADVAASLERVRTTSKTHWMLAAVTAIRYDAGSVELVTSAPIAELSVLLAMPATAITKEGKPPGARPVGSGPFAVARNDAAGGALTLKAFDDHFAGRPYLDQVVLRWYDTRDAEARQFQTGKAQLSARGPAVLMDLKPKYRSQYLQGPASVLVFVGFGRAHGSVTSDPAFRRALDLAIARSAVSGVNAGGERVIATRLPLPVEAGGTALSASAREADLSGARSALARMSDRARLASTKLELLIEDSRPDDREIAQRVALALTKLGVASVITAVPAASYRERVQAGRCDLWIGQLAAPLATPVAWWGAAFAAGGDRWLDNVLATGGLDGAATATEFAVRLPIVPLMFRSVRIWYRSDVRGLDFDAIGRPGYADMFLFGDPVRSKGGR